MNENPKSENLENSNDSASIWTSKSKPNLLLTTKDLGEMRENLSKPFIPSLSSLCEIWENLREDIMARTDKPMFPIGLRSLDEILWGVHKKELMVIGARTSQGKSAFSIFLTKNLVDTGKRVIYFSLEMSKNQILERMLTQICLINNLDLRKGQAKKEVEEREKTFISWIDKVNLLIDDKYGYDFDKIVRIVEIVKPDFVFIDYIQMISTKGYRTKLDAIEEYVRKIKELSVEYNFGAILISQVNRTGVEGAEMQHLKWAGVLEEHADAVIMLRWDWSIADPNKFIFDVKKQRHGEVKNGIILNFTPQHSLFSEKVEVKDDWRNR